jgi:hypothetical protein
MKNFFYKQYIILFIALCIITSCKLTGDFVIVKRNHSNGYYIETPSLVQNADCKTTHFNKRIRPLEIENAIINNNTKKDIIASINPAPIIEKANSEKTISQMKFCEEPQYLKTPVKGDTVIKKKTHNTFKELSDNNKNLVDVNKYDVFSLLAFILVCIAYLLLPLWFIGLTGILHRLLTITIYFPLLGIILGFIGLHRIKKNPDILKGKGLAKTAIIIGFLFYIFLVLTVIIAMAFM